MYWSEGAINDNVDDDRWYGYGNALVPLLPNADIAGFGVSNVASLRCFQALIHHKIILSFLISAFLVLLLTVTAYLGGFLPSHYLRRADRRVLHANSRNEDSRWRDIFEGVTLSFSDQQLVTGLAILVAGYCEMLNNNLSLYLPCVDEFCGPHCVSHSAQRRLQQAILASESSGSWYAGASDTTHYCHAAFAQNIRAR
jgi:hypothetical protein